MAIKAVAAISLSTIKDISSIWRFYCLQPSTAAAPSTPDAATTAAFIKKASKTNADLSSTWAHTEPTYTTGSTNSLYTLDLTVYTDDTYSYSNVCLSSSYEAAKAAYNKAALAQSAAESGARTATNFVTEKGTGGQILVHPEGDTKNAVLIGQDVQIIRNGTVVATYSDAVKIGNASSGHTEISSNEQKFIADDGTIVMDILRDTSRVYAITETAYTDDTEGQSGSYVNKAKLSYPMYKLVGIYARNGTDITKDVTYTYDSSTYTLKNMSNADSDGDPMDMKYSISIKYIPDIDNVTMSVGRYPRVDNRGKLLVLGNGLSNADRRNVLTVDMLGNLWSAAGIKAQTAKFTKRVNLPQKYLWTGALYMSGGHTAELSEKISEQNSGIVLMWSSYDGRVKDENWSFFFVPKIVIGSSHIENKGMLCSAAHPWNRPGKTQDMTFMRKYVYIHNDSITGSDINVNNSYAANTSYVLRGVVGV